MYIFIYILYLFVLPHILPFKEDSTPSNVILYNYIEIYRKTGNLENNNALSQTFYYTLGIQSPFDNGNET